MRFMYVFAFAHTYKGKMFTPQSGGELNPIEIQTIEIQTYSIYNPFHDGNIL